MDSRGVRVPRPCQYTMISPLVSQFFDTCQFYIDHYGYIARAYISTSFVKMEEVFCAQSYPINESRMQLYN